MNEVLRVEVPQVQVSTYKDIKLPYYTRWGDNPYWCKIISENLVVVVEDWQSDVSGKLIGNTTIKASHSMESNSIEITMEEFTKEYLKVEAILKGMAV